MERRPAPYSRLMGNPRRGAPAGKVEAPRLLDHYAAGDACGTCGHTAATHGERLPASCRHGKGPFPVPVGEPVGDRGAAVVAWMASGCRCTGFTPAGASRGR